MKTILRFYVRSPYENSRSIDLPKGKKTIGTLSLDDCKESSFSFLRSLSRNTYLFLENNIRGG